MHGATPRLNVNVNVKAQHQAERAAASANGLVPQATLQLIAERARVSTVAGGVAIAIGDRDGMVCRASSGTAPDVGVRLRPDAGLSGYCLRTGEIVFCSDVQSDPDVNASAAQSLDLGSIIVMPVFAFGRLAALLQVLWPLPRAFDSHQVTRLEHFAKVLRVELEKHHGPPKVEIVAEAFPELELPSTELAAAPLAPPEPRSPVEAAATTALNKGQDGVFGSSPALIRTRRETTPFSAGARTFGKSLLRSRSLLPAVSGAVLLLVLLGTVWYVTRQRSGRPTPASAPPTATVAVASPAAAADSPQPAAALETNAAPATTTKAPTPEVAGRSGASRAPNAIPKLTLLMLANKMRQLKVDDIAALERRATSGNPEAQVVLGLAYTQGSLLQNDPAKAIALYRKAAAQEYAPAEEALGLAYQLGSGVAKNGAQAVHWYTRAAQHGSLMGADELGVMYSSGDHVGQNFAEALKWYRLAAERGDATAEYNLARMYHLGQGVPANPAVEFQWLRKAADQKLPAAQYNLALMYQEGTAVQTDLATAVRLLRESAGRGYTPAQTQLGYVYLKGLGVPVDYAQSLEWYRKAAQQGESTAAYALAVRYYSGGNGVTQDYGEAAKWTRVAAENGHPDAQYNLGVMYERGIGVPADAAEAAKWYRRAADQSVGSAQFRLGMLYASGKGVTRDLVAAYRWLTLGKASAAESSDQLRSLEKDMTAGQISEAQRAAEQWRSMHQRK
jgi:TPR repeat protein